MYRDGLDSQYKLFISLSGLSRVLYRRHVGFLQSAKKGKSCLFCMSSLYGTNMVNVDIFTFLQFTQDLKHDIQHSMMLKKAFNMSNLRPKGRGRKLIRQ